MKEKVNQVSLFDTPDLNTSRSTMDLSFPNKMTANFNKLIPTLMKYTMEGDSWHVKTDFFSRWLMMNSPVFSEYSIKFNTAYVANNQLWGGWQQFKGMGDDQAAQYLLPANRQLLQNMKVPYFTTKDIAKYVSRKIFGFSNHVADSVVGSFHIPDIHPIFCPFFRIFLAPVLLQPASTHEAWSDTSNMEMDIKPNDSTTVVGMTYVIGTTQDNDFWDEQVRLFNVLELTGLSYEISSGYEQAVTTPSASWKVVEFLQQYSQASNHSVLYCYGLNLDYYSNSNLDTLVEMPKDVFFPSSDMDYELSAITGQSVYSDPDIITISQTNWERYTITRYTPHVNIWGVSTIGGLKYNCTDGQVYYPVGYLYNLLPQETMKSTSVYNALNFQDIFNRTLGQCFIKLLMGACSLTDYLGQSWSHHVIRQPQWVAQEISGTKPYADRPHATIGTYNETSDKFEIGIINDVPITFFKYLAYHKLWNDYIRDNRFELREYYTDPYRSPFLRSFQDGSYIQGNLMRSLVGSYDTISGYFPYSNGRYLTTCPHDTLEEDGYIDNEYVFGIDSLIHLLSLRERRVVHDFFTMVTPTSQYGDEAVANVQVDSGGNSYVSTLLLRQATRLQKFLERSNFVGSDFVKQTLAHFGVSPDHCNHCSLRYLGGDKFTPTVSPVTMTSQNSEQSGQVTGEQAAQMYSSGALEEKSFSCNENGVLIQVMTIQNDFLMADYASPDPVGYFDYPLPEFADLGMEQLPYTDVINLDNTPSLNGYTDPMTLFGYIPRYAKWKCSIGQIHGDFKKSLSYWVSKRQFDSDLLHGSFGQGQVENIPQCGKSFLYEKPDYNAFVYTGEEFHHALVDINQIVTCSRLLPKLPSPNVL